ncbi:MAG TPA: hypothetical protein EYP11_01200 [Aquificaceae bacterium]|nr:hypothetical protein [Aquificaceae bacterium]HIQ31370.1 hypothetical protein [Aquifex aeolicus]
MIRVLVFMLLGFGIALAGEGGQHGLLESFWKGFNILLFLGIVYWFGRKPVREAFDRFWKSLTREMDTSEEELKRAREELRKAKEELESAKVRADESIALAKESAEREIKSAEEYAKEVARRVEEKARETVDIELKRAKKELALYGMLRAEEVAKELLKKAFEDPSVHRKYMEKQLKALEDRGNGQTEGHSA